MAEKPQLTLEERRARREARRQKQREENVRRAEQMHAARVAWEAEAPPPADAKLREGAFVGCSGWFYWHWRELFYPQGIATSRWFEHYTKHFRTVELNAPFYAWPTVATVKGWKRAAGRRKFVYTVKVCERITHTKRFAGTKQLVRDFGFIADVLGPHMGCFLFQLPPSYRYSAARLKHICEQLDPNRRNVVEFRHKSWWNKTVYAAFRKRGIIFCSCSGPRLPGDLVKTADEIYVRFHGTKKWYRHDYSKEELTEWAEKIRACGATRVWAYFNNDREGFAIKNAKALERLLKRRRKTMVPPQ